MKITLLSRSKRGGLTVIAGALIFLLFFSLILSDVAVYTMDTQTIMTKLDQERMKEEIMLLSPFTEQAGVGGEVYANTADGNGSVTGVNAYIYALIGFGTNDYVSLGKGEYVTVTSWMVSGSAGYINSAICLVRYKTPQGYPSGTTYLEYNYDGQWRKSPFEFTYHNDWWVGSSGLPGVDSWEKIDTMDVRVVNNSSNKLQIDRIWLIAATLPAHEADIVFKVANKGDSIVHVIAVWVVASGASGEEHTRYNQESSKSLLKHGCTKLWVDVDVYITPGKTLPIIKFMYDNGYLYSGWVVVKVVTERGSISSASYIFY